MRGIDRITDWPVLRLSHAEFERLPEYSATNPTGVSHGKRWRRLDGAHDHRCPAHMRVWMICEYRTYPPCDRFPHGSQNIVRFRPVLTGCQHQ